MEAGNPQLICVRVGMAMDEKIGVRDNRIAKAAEFFFYASLLVELVVVIIDKSDYINPVEGQLFRITFLLAAGKILLTKYSLKEWFAMLLFGIMGVISYKMTGRNEILRIVVFVAACKQMDMKKVLKYVFYITLAGCLLLMLLSVTGIYGSASLETDFGRGYVQTRYCMGLGHPNALHCMFMMLVLLGLYLYNKKMKWYSYLILAALNYSLYLLTDSNTGMLVTLIGIAGGGLMRYWKKLPEMKWVYAAGVLVFLFCVAFSVLAAERSFARPVEYSFRNPVIAFADAHLNGRIRDLYYGSTDAHGTTATWSLFSQPENNYFFDMGFVRVFYWYGILPGMVYIILNILLFWQCAKKKDGMGLVMMAALAVYTIVEAHIISVYIGRNYILFLMGMYGSSMPGLNSEQEEYMWKAYRFIGKWSSSKV